MELNKTDFWKELEQITKETNEKAREKFKEAYDKDKNILYKIQKESSEHCKKQLDNLQKGIKLSEQEEEELLLINGKKQFLNEFGDKNLFYIPAGIFIENLSKVWDNLNEKTKDIFTKVFRDENVNKNMTNDEYKMIFDVFMKDYNK